MVNIGNLAFVKILTYIYNYLRFLAKYGKLGAF